MAGVDVLVLGPVVVRRHGRDAVPAGLTRDLVGVLALAGQDGLPDTQLITSVWGERADQISRSTAAVAMHRARRWLADTIGDDDVHIDRTPTGFVLTGARIDAAEFTRACAAAADLPDEQRVTELAAALALWRGEPLAGVEPAGPIVAMVQRLRRAHRGAVTDYGRALLRVGRPAAAVDAVLPMADREPMDEPLHAVLIEALAADGRRSEALDRYERLRRRLADELGVHPGRELGDAFVRVLRDNPPDPPAAPWSPVVPAQLPPDTTGFTGRAASLSELDDLVHASGTSPAIGLITGIGGVGKTTLAVHWAHRVAARFPDGQLYVDLRGYADRHPVPPLVALGRFLRALGVPSGEIPDETDEAAALYRSVLARRRMIVLLDNAVGAGQVRPLLPGTGTCVALVTSRGTLDGLVTREGARRYALDTLRPAESLRLLATACGKRITAEPDAAAELAALCAHLPLALRIVAADLAMRPQRTVAAQAAALRGDRLAGLSVQDDDPDVSVRATFTLSYQRLAEPDRRLFRLLGLVPGADIGIDAVTVLMGRPVSEVADGLARLVEAHLVNRNGDRFSSHDLIREYARERAADEDGPAVSAAARSRLFGWYAATSHAASMLLYPSSLRMPVPAGASIGMTFADDEAARRWFDDEFAGLCAVIRAAAEHGPAEVSWLLMDALDPYCYFGGLVTERRTNTEVASAAAAAAGDRLGVAACAVKLAHVYAMGGHGASPDESARRYAEAAQAARDSGWVAGELHALDGKASILAFGGDPEEAVRLFTQVIDRCREVGGQDANEILAIGNLGIAYEILGRLDEALECQRQNVERFRAIGKPANVMHALANLSSVYHNLGRLADARRSAEEARELAERSSELRLAPAAVDTLTKTYLDLGLIERATAETEALLAFATDAGNSYLQVNARCTLGDVALRQRNWPDALDHYRWAANSAAAGWFVTGSVAGVGVAFALCGLGKHDEAVAEARTALATASRVACRLEEAAALTALATAHHSGGDHEAAATHAEHAVDILHRSGARLREARAREVLAAARAAQGDHTAAALHRDAARAAFTATGAADSGSLSAIFGWPGA